MEKASVFILCFSWICLFDQFSCQSEFSARHGGLRDLVLSPADAAHPRPEPRGPRLLPPDLRRGEVQQRRGGRPRLLQDVSTAPSPPPPAPPAQSSPGEVASQYWVSVQCGAGKIENEESGATLRQYFLYISLISLLRGESLLVRSYPAWSGSALTPSFQMSTGDKLFTVTLWQVFPPRFYLFQCNNMMAKKCVQRKYGFFFLCQDMKWKN